MKKEDTGVIYRTPKSVYKCGHCGELIILGETEVGNRLYIKSGVPICARCRIMRTASGNRIRADRNKIKADKHDQKIHTTKKEDNRIMKIAAESQEDAEKLKDADRQNKKSIII